LAFLLLFALLEIFLCKRYRKITFIPEILYTTENVVVPDAVSTFLSKNLVIPSTFGRTTVRRDHISSATDVLTVSIPNLSPLTIVSGSKEEQTAM
jgi:hypothetical protein